MASSVWHVNISPKCPASQHACNRLHYRRTDQLGVLQQGLISKGRLAPRPRNSAPYRASAADVRFLSECCCVVRCSTEHSAAALFQHYWGAMVQLQICACTCFNSVKQRYIVRPRVLPPKMRIYRGCDEGKPRLIVIRYCTRYDDHVFPLIASS